MKKNCFCRLRLWLGTLPGGDNSHLAQRARLCRAGLRESRLRQMDPDARVAALEQADLDPYDYLYLAC